MMMKINKRYITAEEKNDLYKTGYRYIVEGDFETLDTTDPWSGMPNTTNNIYAFSDKSEAEALALTQIWVFNPDIHSTVEELPEHTETHAEYLERTAKEKAERKAKAYERDAKKAAKEGITVKEFRTRRAKKAQIKSLQNEIERLEDELKEKKKDLKKLVKSLDK